MSDDVKIRLFDLLDDQVWRLLEYGATSEEIKERVTDAIRDFYDD